LWLWRADFYLINVFLFHSISRCSRICRLRSADLLYRLGL
jgi:hypothetical protein